MFLIYFLSFWIGTTIAIRSFRIVLLILYTWICILLFALFRYQHDNIYVAIILTYIRHRRFFFILKLCYFRLNDSVDLYLSLS